MARMRGKLDALKEVSTAAYLAIPGHVYKESSLGLWENIISKGLGVLVVNTDKTVEEKAKPSITPRPSRPWDNLFSKLIEKHPEARTHIEKAFNKLFKT